MSRADMESASAKRQSLRAAEGLPALLSAWVAVGVTVGHDGRVLSEAGVGGLGLWGCSGRQREGLALDLAGQPGSLIGLVIAQRGVAGAAPFPWTG